MRVFTVLQVHKLNYEKSLILHLDVTVKPRLVHWRLILGVNFNVLVLIFAIWFSVSSIHHAVQKGTNLLNQIDTITLVANTTRLNLNNTYTSSKRQDLIHSPMEIFPKNAFWSDSCRDVFWSLFGQKKNRNAKDEVRGLEATLPRDVYKAWYGERFHEEPIWDGANERVGSWTRFSLDFFLLTWMFFLFLVLCCFFFAFFSSLFNCSYLGIWFERSLSPPQNRCQSCQ